MTELDLSLDDFRKELQTYLKEKSRKKTQFTKPLLFKIDSKIGFKVIDSTKTAYDVDMTQLQSFKEHFQDKAYKYIRLNEWDIDLDWNGKKCQEIVLNAHSITLIASKTQKRDIRECPFRFVVQNKDGIAKLNQNLKNYLNRIGKRHLISMSENVSAEMKNLIGFIKRSNVINPIQRISISAETSTPEVDPLVLLSNQGKQTLQRLIGFVSRQGFIDFLYNKQFSEEGVRKMRKLAFPEAVQNKKFTKNMVQTLQKNQVQ